MGTVSGACEIVEAKEVFSAESRMIEKVNKERTSKQGRVYSIEDDINRLFDSVNIKTSVKAEAVRKNPMKRPIRANSSQASGIGLSESVNLKQALRGLCISQASEIAAMKKRSLKSARSSGTLDVGVGTLSQLHKAVVVKPNGYSLSINDGKRNLLEISIPSKIMANLSETAPESAEVSAPDTLNESCHPSSPSSGTLVTKTKMIRAPSKDKIVPLPSESFGEKSSANLVQHRNLQLIHSLHCVRTIKNVLEVDKSVSTKADTSSESVQPDMGLTDILNSESCSTSCNVDVKIKNTRTISPRQANQLRKAFVNRKVKTQSDCTTSTSCAAKGVVDTDLSNSPRAAKLITMASKGFLKHESKINRKAASNTENASTDVGSSVADADANQLCASKVNVGVSNVIAKTDGKSRSREKGEFSQSSKSSMGEYSCSTSEESSVSGSTRCNRPHMSKDLRWESIDSVQKLHGFLSLRHFKLLKRLGSGDIGTVYLAELAGTNCLFALKVMDNEFLAQRKKLVRAQTEREILQMLDHPFLPTLYAYFTTDKLSCLVMEYCPGGDLHVIRQKQPSRCFSEQAARFYVAEVLLALEYLHMLGIVYRDLKPENILVREDGHVMLSDFDLSLRCVVNPTLLRSSSTNMETAKMSSSFCSESSCIDPFCLQPSWQVSCFTPRLLTATSKTRKLKSDQAGQNTTLPQLVAEPTNARSNSFVGTHEYLAPEIVKGEGHGSAVDWWTFGIFIYELLYGKTPFKGSSNEDTLANVVSQPLRFPETPLVSFHAKDLIRGLLVKQPQNRLGFVKGTAEVKQHPFFEGLNWALIRCAVPPERPRFRDVGRSLSTNRTDNSKAMGVDSSEHIEFELF